MHDAARFFPIRYSYDDDPRPGVATIRGEAGCNAIVVNEDDSGTIYALIDYSDASSDGIGAIEVAWRIAIDSDAASRSRISAGTSARLPVAKVAAKFADDIRIENVRPFRGFDDRANAPDRSAAVSATEPGWYEQQFTDLEKEWWGLAWTWPETSQ